MATRLFRGEAERVQVATRLPGQGSRSPVAAAGGSEGQRPGGGSLAGAIPEPLGAAFQHLDLAGPLLPLSFLLGDEDLYREELENLCLARGLRSWRRGRYKQLHLTSCGGASLLGTRGTGMGAGHHSSNSLLSFAAPLDGFRPQSGIYKPAGPYDRCRNGPGAISNGPGAAAADVAGSALTAHTTGAAASLLSVVFPAEVCMITARCLPWRTGRIPPPGAWRRPAQAGGVRLLPCTGWHCWDPLLHEASSNYSVRQKHYALYQRID